MSLVPKTGLAEIKRAIFIRTTEMKTQRCWFEPHWRELSNFIVPWSGRGLRGTSLTEVNDGSKKHQNVFNSTAEDAMDVLSAGMHSGLTSPARPWFRLTIPDLELADSYEVKAWLAEVERRIYSVFARANVYSALHLMYGELGSFGTACVSIEEDYDTVIRARAFSCGEYWLGTDHRGAVNTFYREFWMTAGQIVEKFGIENVSDSTKALFTSNTLEKPVLVCQLIEPNDQRIKSATFDRYAFRSFYFERGIPGDKFLSMGGYHEFPVLAPRWEAKGANVYGYCPGMKVLADVKMLQKMERKGLVALDKMVEPPMTAPGSMKKEVINSMPGGLTYVDPNTQSAVRPLYQTNFDFASVENKIMRVEDRIRRGLFYNLFLMIASRPESGQMTATEVLERHEEKLLMMGPVLERVHNEALTPVIDRTFAIMSRGGLIPPAPESIRGQELKVEFISVLAQAQKQVGATSMQQTIAFVGSIASAAPEVVDKIDFDQAVELYADYVGVSPKLLRSQEAVAGIRNNRAQAQQAAQSVENAKIISETTQNLANSDTQGNNALTSLFGSGQTGGPIQR